MKSTLPRNLIFALTSVVLVGCSPAARKGRALARADAYFHASEYEKAKIEYLNVLRIDPSDPKAIQQVGLIWAEQGDPVRAFPFLLKARDLDPKNVSVRSSLALAFVSVGQFSEARKEASAVFTQPSAQGEAILLLAQTARSREEIESTQNQLQKSQVLNTASGQVAASTLFFRRGDKDSASSALAKALALDSESAPAHLAMGNLLLSEGKATEAEKELESAANLVPLRSPVRLRYAEFELQEGKRPEAVALLTSLTQKAPDYIPAWCLRARIALADKRLDDASASIENVFARDDQHIEARVIQSEIFLTKGKTDEALSCLLRLDHDNSNVAMVKYQLARTYFAGRDSQKAAAVLRQALALDPSYTDAILLLAQIDLAAGDSQEVVKPLEAILKAHPKMDGARQLLAAAYQSAGRMDEAIGLMRMQVRDHPESPLDLVRLGVAVRSREKLTEARAAFENALKIDPANADARLQLVEMDIADNDLPSAKRRVELQFQATPNAAVAQFMRAKVLVAEKKWDDAQVALQKCIEVDASYLNAYELLVDVYVVQGKVPQAIFELQTFLGRQPDNSRALMLLALMHDKRKEYLQAKDAYEKLLALRPDFIPALNNLAYIYSDSLDDFGKAVALARRASVLSPGNAAVEDTLGWAFYKAGNYEEAFALLQSSAGKLLENPDAQYHLGCASYSMGRWEAAMEAFGKALAANIEFAGKKDAERRVLLLTGTAGLSVADLQEIAKQDPNDILALMRLGEASEAQKDYLRAVSMYEEALKVNPKLLAPVERIARINAVPLHNWGRAMEYAKRAREIAPSDPEVAGILGSAAFHVGQHKWAYSLLDESRRGNRADLATLHDFAWAAYSLGKVAEARDAMNAVLTSGTLDSFLGNDAKAFLELTDPRLSMEDVQSLEPRAQIVLTADPTFVPAQMLKGDTERQRGERKKAIAVFEAVLQRFPEFSPAQKALVGLYSENQETLDNAYELALKLRNTLPDDYEVKESLAAIAYGKNDFRYAVRLFAECARTKPLDAKSLYYLGLAHFKLSEKAQSRDALERALASGLSEPLAVDAKKVIASLGDK